MSEWDKVSRAASASEWDAISIPERRKAVTEPPPIAGGVDPSEGMTWGEKALANVGAGIDTAWQGAKQIVGAGEGDEAIKEKRRIDEGLAEATTGGGVLQVAGEVLPTIPLGMGAGAAATRAGGLAARMAASPTLSAMGGGAAAGALVPVTSDESRLTNIALGAGGGAVAPHVLKLAMKGGRGLAQTAQRVGAALPGALGARAAGAVGSRRTADLLRRELGDAPLPQDVYTPHPFLQAEGVRPSAAVATQDPRLASLERGSRTSAGDEWMGFDRAAHEGRFKVLDEGLQTQGDLDTLLAKANQIGSEVEGVYGKAGIKSFNKEMDDFHALLQQAKQSATYHGKPTVQAAVNYIERTMRKAGTVTPELLHNIRRTVSGGLKGVPGIGDEGVRATASEPFVISLAEAMDRVLDKSTKGRFSKWKGEYADVMGKADSAKADINIRAKFLDPATGMMRKTASGLDGDPVVTAHALKQAVATAGSKKRGPRKGQNLLSTGSEDVLKALGRDLDAQALLQRAKAASTGGSGSDTASNMSQAALMEMFLPSGLGLAQLVRSEGGRNAQQAMQRQLAQLLQDPAALRRFVAAQQQQALLRGQAPAIQGLGAGAGGLALPFAAE